MPTFLSRTGDLAYPVFLIGLLLAEILCLTIFFDTASLDGVPSVWAQLIGWAPQYLRLAVAVLSLILLFNRRQLWDAIRAPDGIRLLVLRPRHLIGHFCAFVFFYWITGKVMEGEFSSSNYRSLWALTWFAAGAATLLMWCLAMMPRPRWFVAARQGQKGIICGAALGLAAWATGLLTEELWKPMAGLTFRVVSWILHLTYAPVVSDPVRLVIGTSKFKVVIAEQCSGYEGIGLILTFLSVYLWLFRKDLRFPKALLLLPA